MQQPRHDLNLVGVPEPTGLGGAPSSHGDFDPHRQGLTHGGADVGSGREQRYDEAVNLQQHALAQQVLPRNQQQGLRSALGGLRVAQRAFFQQ